MNQKAVKFDKWPGMDITDPPVDFMSLAAAYGLPSERVEKGSEITSAVRKAMDLVGRSSSRFRSTNRKADGLGVTREDFGGIEGPLASRVDEALEHQDTIFKGASRAISV